MGVPDEYYSKNAPCANKLEIYVFISENLH